MSKTPEAINAELLAALETALAIMIFEYADFGVVGDIFQVVPQVIEQLRTRRG